MKRRMKLKALERLSTSSRYEQVMVTLLESGRSDNPRYAGNTSSSDPKASYIADELSPFLGSLVWLSQDEPVQVRQLRDVPDAELLAEIARRYPQGSGVGRQATGGW